MMWAAILAASAGCYLLKVVGLTLPVRVLDHPRIQRIAGLLPIALLAALALMQTASTGRHLQLDARAGAMVIAVALVIKKAPFIVVVGLAVASAALIRLLS